MPIDWDINLDFEAFQAQIEERLPGALAKGLEHLRTVTTPKVPVETGNLAGSGGITVDGDGGELYYPGPYALYQHEGVYYRHGQFGAPLTHMHGESFFLETSVVSEGENIIRIVGDALLGDS